MATPPNRKKRKLEHSGSSSASSSTVLANSAPKLSSLTRTLLFATIVLSYLILRYGRTFLVHDAVNSLPRSYALCSPNGTRNVYTVDEQNRKVQCLLIEGDLVKDVGDIGEIKSRRPHLDVDFTVQYIPSGAIVVPGMSDAHCHILEYGYSRQIPLGLGKSVQETVALVHDFVLANPDILHNTSKVVQGWGWDHASWPGQVMPSWQDLAADPLLANRRIVLQSKDGHALWVSNRTLAENGPYPKKVDGGYVLRDKEGNPSGIFVDSAQSLIPAPPQTFESLLRSFTATVKKAHSLGLTSLHDAGFKEESLGFFRNQSENGPLPIRIYGMTYFDDAAYFGGDSSGSASKRNEAYYWGELTPKLHGMSGNTRLSSRSVKIFADGALRTGGAALFEPYADAPETKGVMRISGERLKEVIPRYLKDGWQVNVHAIGDRANALVLDAFADAQRDGVDLKALRPRIEHAQIMREEDMQRLVEMGLVASIQPTHAISDMWFAEPRLGPVRVKTLYAWRTLLNQTDSEGNRSGRIALGSDFPVEDPNPMKALYAAITRLSIPGDAPPASVGGGHSHDQDVHGEGLWLAASASDAARPAFESAVTTTGNSGPTPMPEGWADPYADAEKHQIVMGATTTGAFPHSSGHSSEQNTSPPPPSSPHGREGWFPSQRLTRLEVLRGLTIDAAYASFSENELGSLEIGKKADWVVIEGDVFHGGPYLGQDSNVENSQDGGMDPLDVLKTRVLATAIDGKIVFGGLPHTL